MKLPVKVHKVPGVVGRPRSQGFTQEQHQLIAPELQTTIRGLSRITEGLQRCFKRRSKVWTNAAHMVRDADALYQALTHHDGTANTVCHYMANVKDSYCLPFWRWAMRFEERTRNRRALPTSGITREMHAELASELYGIEAGFLHIIRGMNRAGFSMQTVTEAQRAARSMSELIAALDEDFQEQEAIPPQDSPYRFHMEVADGAASGPFAYVMAGVLNPRPLPDWIVVRDTTQPLDAKETP